MNINYSPYELTPLESFEIEFLREQTTRVIGGRLPGVIMTGITNDKDTIERVKAETNEAISQIVRGSLPYSDLRKNPNINHCLLPERQGAKV